MNNPNKSTNTVFSDESDSVFCLQNVGRTIRGVSQEKIWIDVFIDFMFYFLIVFNVVPLWSAHAKYLDVFVIGIFIPIFSYLRRRGSHYSYFTEECLIMLHLFGLYVLISAGWALNPSHTLYKFFQIEKNFIVFTCFYVYYRGRNDSLDRIQRIIEYAGITIALIYIFFVGIDEIRGMAEAERRLAVVDEYGDIITNINDIALMLLIPFVFLLKSFLEKGFAVKHIGMIPICALILLTGSRKGMVGLYLALFLIYILSVILCKKSKQLFLAFSSLLIMLIVLSNIDLSLLTNVSNKRFEEMLEGSDGSTSIRLEMVKLGWRIFFMNPLVGCGIGCPRVLCERFLGHDCYLHNDFLEILAGGGLIGFIIYYTPYLRAGLRICKDLRKSASTKTTYTTIAIFVCFVELIMFKLGAVTYYDKDMIFYTLPVFLFYSRSRYQRTV